MTKFQGAVIEEQGVKVAVVVVKPRVLRSTRERDQVVADFQRQVFQGLPVVLMAQDSKGRPKYYGRKDLSRFLSNVPLESIPWREYTLH